MSVANRLNMVAAVSSVAASLSLAGPAVAKERPVVVSATQIDKDLVRRVSYRDLNLARAGDVRLLNRRLSAAVGAICYEAVGPAPDFYSEMSCRKGTWRGIRPQLASAVERARQIATNGVSAIPAVAISVTVAWR